MIIAAATNDFMIVADLTESSSCIKQEMGNFFELVDLGSINWLLGVSIIQNVQNRTISLGQEAYIVQILICFRLSNTKPAATPMEQGANFSPDSPAVSSIFLSPAKRTTY